MLKSIVVSAVVLALPAISFSQTKSAAPIVSSFTLVNADTGRAVSGFDPMPSGATIDLSATGKNLNIRANTATSTVGSVRFGLDANNLFRAEKAAPYYLAGDKDGKVLAWTPSAGTHTVTATPFSGPNFTGQKGATLRLSFTVKSAAPPPTTPKVFEYKNKPASPLFVGDNTPNSQQLTINVPDDFVPQKIEVAYEVEGFLVQNGISFGVSGNAASATSAIWEQSSRARTFTIPGPFTRAAKGTWTLTIDGPSAELAGGYVYSWTLRLTK